MWLLTQNAPLNIEDMRRDFTREFPYVLLMRRVVVWWGETLCVFWYDIIHNLHYTAIPYSESTGFLQGIPCVVFPPLHALAVYRV